MVLGVTQAYLNSPDPTTWWDLAIWGALGMVVAWCHGLDIVAEIRAEHKDTSRTPNFVWLVKSLLPKRMW